jgi:TorA maturation chaperone TorD
MSESIEVFCSQVSADLMMLARLQDLELDATGLRQLQDKQFPHSLALQLENPVADEAIQLLAAALVEIGSEPQDQVLDELSADFANIYLINQYSASPCESVWIDEDGLTMQEPMFQIRKWYQRYRLEVPDWRQRTDDHLVFQLQFIASLVEQGDETSLRDVCRFMDEHILRWIDDFSRRVASRAITPFYAGLAILTATYLDEIREILGLVLGEPRPSEEDIEQRMKPITQVEVPVPEAFVPGVSPSW